ncbi:uncharacterized protein LOC113499939 [Trichoplusia ni]|uniref:Uncharacterized protein LOC113499939 n=1 Tax=Trichoplusia ni TaxID=7111 RepID=A0A7E5W6R8_TRINI|nr:uncharacterized protein LOC113499939 [Trichoplusia ni]
MTKSSSDTSVLNEPDFKKEHYRKSMLEYTVERIKKRTLFYIGVPKDCYDLIKIMHEHTGIPEYQILLCLKKNRLDTKFSELSDEFGISKTYVSKIVSENIPKIAEIMRPFIVKLDKISIKRCLPIAFRKNYYNVTCILDCLEIEIQKPGKAVNQSLTWSEYKKANTIKYLVSSTPNGLVNYISQGYGGRISDVCLVETCDFLKCLPSGSHVMADRGFKHIEPLLFAIGCKLTRPPSVVSGNKLSKEEVKETKKIASLRIHIERVIRRIREFSFLKSHACVNNNLLGKLDDIIVIACGLINLQNSLINK